MFDDVIHPELLNPDLEFKVDNWYCVYCIYPQPDPQGWSNDYNIKTHLLDSHQIPRGEALLPGDAVKGYRLSAMLREWQRENDRLVRVFSRELASVLDVSDLEYEWEQHDAA